MEFKEGETMRKLMYFTIGFAAACALCAYGASLPIRIICIAALVFFCASAGRNAKPLPRALLALMGCAVGLFWYGQYHSHYLSAPVALDGQTVTASIRTSDYSYETTYGMAVDGTVRLDGKTYQVRTYLDAGEPLEPGTILTGAFHFRVTTPDGAEEATYHQGKGIFLLAYQTDQVTAAQSSPTWREYPAELRHQIKATLQTHFPEDTYPFAKALLIGDTADLNYETDTNFKVSGIRHVVAVSGLHVSILFTLLSTVTFRKRYLTALVGFPTLFLFAAVAGFTPSVTRACIMSALMLLALLAGKEYDGPTALAFAGLVMLAVNPLTITSVGFQLSVGSVAGIYLFDPGIRKWLLSLFGDTKGRKVKAFFVRWVTASISITLSAMTLTTPLCACYFGTVSLIGAVTNLLALWVISFIFYGLIAVCLLHPVLPAGAALLAKLVAIPIRYVLVIAKTLAHVPMAAVYTRSPYITAWLVFVYILLILFLVSQNRKPRILSCCAVLGLCLALLASWAEPMLDDVRFTVLDIGQGQCLLLQTEGKTYMIDCGGDSDTETADIAAETLLSQGIAKLDGLILTHLDRDHAGAAANLLSRIDTDLLILPPEPTDLARCTSGEVIYASNDLKLTLDRTTITIFAPIFPGNSNENSLCLLLDTEKCVILITGDRSGFGERMLLRNADIPDVDILVAGHHGSKNSTCEELLQAVDPELVCISVGADNSYGHPAPELLQRLTNHGCTICRTDQNGTITIRR